jgi:hypothetical protein
MVKSFRGEKGTLIESENGLTNILQDMYGHWQYSLMNFSSKEFDSNFTQCERSGNDNEWNQNSINRGISQKRKNGLLDSTAQTNKKQALSFSQELFAGYRAL